MAINPFEQSLVAMPAAGPVPEKKVPLFSNKLFLQYLAAAGQDIGQGQAIGTNVNTVTQQAITAESTKNYHMKILQSMLGPDAVPGGSATVNDKEVIFKYPAELFNEGNPLNQQVQENMRRLGGGAAPATPAAPVGGARKPSPFDIDQLDFSASDLAGLTPEIMTNALNMGLNLRKSLVAERAAAEAAAVDIPYKKALTEQAVAAAEKSRRPPVTKDERTTLQKDYAWAVKLGFEGTPKEWKTADTTAWTNYGHAVDGGYEGTFDDWQTKMASLSGGIDPAARKRDVSQVEGRVYFSDPKKYSTSLDKHLTEYRNDVLWEMEEEEIAPLLWKETVEFTERRMWDGGAKNIERWESKDGSKIKWVVTWSDGTTQEVIRGR